MAIPERIGKYAVSEILGKGAMGVVYKAFDPHIRRAVAIKVIHKELLGDAGAPDSIAARFRNEAHAVGRVAHPAVVAIHEFVEDGDGAYIVMEYVPGRNLEQILEATPLLEETSLLRIMDQLLAALAVAHAHGVWHRDIKPANLILTAAGEVKLMDFGIARVEHARLTQAASMIGTPGYMAPEQYRGEGVDHRADLFSCGVLLYRLLTGRKPFTGPPDVVMFKILHEEAPAASVAAAGRRRGAYDAIVARAMAKSPALRFGSAAEMRQALLAAAAGTGPTASTQDQGSDATVIVPPRHPARPAEAAATASSTLPGWDRDSLSQVERALASHIGPLARVLVRQAAAVTVDLTSLATALSVHIAEPARRQHFMDAAIAGAPPPVEASLPRGLSDEFRTKALQVMLRHVGPIARVVVRRAGDRCDGDRERFVALLMEAIAAGDRAGLMRDLADSG